MLTRLRFKNWRSLRDVTIDDLKPITVFIGANSSGKTNIMDALRFHRDSLQKGLVEVVNELGYTRIQTDARKGSGRVELEFTFQIEALSANPISETLILKFSKRSVPFKYGRILREGDTILDSERLEELPPREEIRSLDIENEVYFRRTTQLLGSLFPLIRKRWQILGDNFMPRLHLSSREGGSPYVIESDARNMLLMLRFMQRSYPELFGKLEDDLHWILSYIDDLDVWQEREEDDLELLIHESVGRTAPTVSNGTARLIAMLTAFYALDMPQGGAFNGDEQQILSPSMPGLVVIEEPDTALNPGVLRNFAEQLRYFTTGEHPRQVIMTTHNPRFLDYFEYDEVRVVTRDEQGYTNVEKIPKHVKDIWHDEYTLGEVWMTNSFGGLSE